jgi:hypothetical protein
LLLSLVMTQSEDCALSDIRIPTFARDFVRTPDLVRDIGASVAAILANAAAWSRANSGFVARNPSDSRATRHLG